VYGGVLILIFGALTVVLSLEMPIGTLRAAGPGLFPLILGVLLVLLAGGFTLGTFLRNRRTQGAKPVSPELSGSAGPVVGFMAVIGFAAGFLDTLGYAPTAFVIVFALLQILGRRQWRWNLLISLATSAGSHFIFIRWLQIPFLQGWLGL
jgi:putative tricarboxylic transport membrane protein